MRLIPALALVVMAGTANAETLTLYTSQSPEIAQQTVDAFQAKHPDIKVEWTRNGTSQLMNVLRAEIQAGAVKPDVLLVADTINLGLLKKEGRLMAYPDAKVGGYDAGTYDKDKMFFGTKIVATGIAYNTASAKPVATWGELLTEDNRGQIAVPSPLYSGAALNHLHSVVDVPGIGWDFYKGLAKIGVTPEGGNGPALKAVASGLAKYGIIADADVIRAKASGSPVDLIFPKDGVSFITEPVAILSTTKHPEAAKTFVDFLLSKDGQALVAQQGNMPIDPSVTPPAGFPKLSDIKLLPMDADKAVGTDRQVRETFTSIFGG
ncbi:ABC transporter substrate-binding protein [Chelatococcus asaccharovorans]|uniref:Iron(III) transport system substrate-binding protein n=1 Tax=Chelatococcus asaccharovorans TaxID=28210 RepID=A0A2V3U162_9HYPH|nr:ABC transporter substrate-binding protein [Chelatococcus asaccharovorans]MBS7707589.1 ABC transporter substrate-binding protein [Chelatococcus asaccharovorans]PXW55163.1 iron(III) transport system substrate-binding protein [Chelatococcus asaccharovorans]